jgi:hypothetical protein
MYGSPEETLAALDRAGYFTDAKTASTVYLAGKIHRPIMVEGPAGSGKTELAQSVARAYKVPLLRLQCYQGINEEKAIGQYDKSLQELYVLLMGKSQRTPDWAEIKREVTSRAFFVAGPLLEAIEQQQSCVLLIDEIDKVDYAFEAQAFKRACSCFGLGRYFYNFAEMWVEVDQCKQPKQLPRLPSWALPKGERQTTVEQRQTPQTAGRPETAVQKGPLDAGVTGRIEGCRQQLGSALFADVLQRVAKAQSARDIPNQKLQQIVLSSMESCARGMSRIRAIAAELPETKFYSILDEAGVPSLDRIPSFDVLKQLGNEMSQAASNQSAA